MNLISNSRRKKWTRRFVKDFRRDFQLYVLCTIPVLYFVIFHYLPMYGVQIAFKNFRAVDGIWGSQWVGFDNFRRFFASFQFETLIKNTLALSLSQLLVGFPVPVLLAILLNQMKNLRYRRFVQTVTYCPHFISIVVLTGMLQLFLSPRSGLINHLIIFLGGSPSNFMASPEWFRPIYVLSGIWQNAGWNAIIYIAALAGISPDLYEAADIDGAGKLQIIRYIDLPGLLPTAIMMLILEIGKIMSIGFQKAYLMQNTLNITTSEIIPTYIYKIGLIDQQFSYSAAIGLFNNIINIILLVTVNKIVQHTSEYSLW